MELFPCSFENNAAMLRPEVRFGEFEREAQNAKAEALGIPASAPVFVITLYVALMALSALNVTPIRTPKLSGRWYYAVTLYAACLSALFGWQLLLH